MHSKLSSRRPLQEIVPCATISCVSAGCNPLFFSYAITLSAPFIACDVCDLLSARALALSLHPTLLPRNRSDMAADSWTSSIVFHFAMLSGESRFVKNMPPNSNIGALKTAALKRYGLNAEDAAQYKLIMGTEEQESMKPLSHLKELTHVDGRMIVQLLCCQLVRVDFPDKAEKIRDIMQMEPREALVELTSMNTVEAADVLASVGVDHARWLFHECTLSNVRRFAWRRVLYEMSASTAARILVGIPSAKAACLLCSSRYVNVAHDLFDAQLAMALSIVEVMLESCDYLEASLILQHMDTDTATYILTKINDRHQACVLFANTGAEYQRNYLEYMSNFAASWSDVTSVKSTAALLESVVESNLMTPVQIAKILEDMGAVENAANILSAMDNGKRILILQDMDVNFMIELLEELEKICGQGNIHVYLGALAIETVARIVAEVEDSERAVDILQNMEKTKAAALLTELEVAQALEVFTGMTKGAIAEFLKRIPMDDKVAACVASVMEKMEAKKAACVLAELDGSGRHRILANMDITTMFDIIGQSSCKHVAKWLSSMQTQEASFFLVALNKIKRNKIMQKLEPNRRQALEEYMSCRKYTAIMSWNNKTSAQQGETKRKTQDFAAHHTYSNTSHVILHIRYLEV